MNAKSSQHEQIDIEDIAERAERGEDISAHFTKTYTAKQRVNIDFPLALLRAIDAECQRIGITRQAWIKMVCAEHLHHHGPHNGEHLGTESHPLKGDDQ
jgi:hypothetical protein